MDSAFNLHILFGNSSVYLRTACPATSRRVPVADQIPHGGSTHCLEDCFGQSTAAKPCYKAAQWVQSDEQLMNNDVLSEHMC